MVERTVRIREVRGFDPLQVHQKEDHPIGVVFLLLEGDRISIAHAGGVCIHQSADW